MLERKHLVKFIHKRCERIRNCLRVYSWGQDPEALHVLRVEVKKLKAVVQLLNACCPRPGRRAQLHGLRQIYAQAGLIRTAQVNEKLLQAYHLHNDAFERQQAAILAEEPLRFCSRAKAYRHRVRRAGQDLAARATSIKNACILELFRQRLDELHRFFTGDFTAEGLHERRKTLKTLLFLHSLLPAALAESLHLDLSWLDSLQERIGRWNDTDQALRLLSENALAGEELLAALRQEQAARLREVAVLARDFQPVSIG
ncbi:CHAD domain-containing protein [Paraflavisolibacter sp. H34]|uniref:CHAD domain-containing protein n=1 Tax=Huijunlia imazamoxiresistens TaxID=3127457 RepID=UPI0030158D40